MRNYDVAIIGAGVTGCAIARHLSRFRLKIALIDAAEDVATGASRANSAIVHAGYDCPAGTLMAKLNVRGNALYSQWCRELDVPFQRVGSLVAAFNPDEKLELRWLYERGLQNGVPEMEMLTGEQARALYERCAALLAECVPVQTGVFQADMQVSLVNDGPFTILLDSRRTF